MWARTMKFKARVLSAVLVITVLLVTYWFLDYDEPDAPQFDAYEVHLRSLPSKGDRRQERPRTNASLASNPENKFRPRKPVKDRIGNRTTHVCIKIPV